MKKPVYYFNDDRSHDVIMEKMSKRPVLYNASGMLKILDACFC